MTLAHVASHSVRCGPVQKRKNFSSEWDDECSDAIGSITDSSLTDETEPARELSSAVELIENPPSTSAELDSGAAVATEMKAGAEAEAVARELAEAEAEAAMDAMRHEATRQIEAERASEVEKRESY